MNEIFNEKKLGQDIYATWGEYGAHGEVYRGLLKQREELIEVAKECLEALQPDSGEVENLNADDPGDLRSSIRQALWLVKFGASAIPSEEIVRQIQDALYPEGSLDRVGNPLDVLLLIEEIVGVPGDRP